MCFYSPKLRLTNYSCKKLSLGVTYQMIQWAVSEENGLMKEEAG